MSADANRRNVERAFREFNDHDVEAVRALQQLGAVPAELGSGHG